MHHSVTVHMKQRPHAAAKCDYLNVCTLQSAVYHEYQGCREKSPLFARQTVYVLKDARNLLLPATVIHEASNGSYLVQIIGKVLMCLWPHSWMSLRCHWSWCTHCQWCNTNYLHTHACQSDSKVHINWSWPELAFWPSSKAHGFCWFGLLAHLTYAIRLYCPVSLTLVSLSSYVYSIPGHGWWKWVHMWLKKLIYILNWCILSILHMWHIYNIWGAYLLLRHI